MPSSFTEERGKSAPSVHIIGPALTSSPSALPMLRRESARSDSDSVKDADVVVREV